MPRESRHERSRRAESCLDSASSIFVAGLADRGLQRPREVQRHVFECDINLIGSSAIVANVHRLRSRSRDRREFWWRNNTISPSKSSLLQALSKRAVCRNEFWSHYDSTHTSSPISDHAAVAKIEGCLRYEPTFFDPKIWGKQGKGLMNDINAFCKMNVVTTNSQDCRQTPKLHSAMASQAVLVICWYWRYFFPNRFSSSGSPADFGEAV